ncbi:MAG: GMC family oxidoreductase [Acidobacteria bacterium]|nr:GMC family oxidoreductase [Acidobacteriota bacterium]
MEIDLVDCAGDVAHVETVRAQVCVVGGGIAGLTVARRLVELGVDVVVLEAGGRGIEDEGQKAFEAATLDGHAHVGTSEGRVRALGGTSWWWGGQLLGMSRADAAGWPVGWEELKRYTADAERMLGVDALPYEAAEFFAAAGAVVPPMLAGLGGVDARVSKWMGFSRRNLAATMGREMARDARVRVLLHASVTELVLAEDGGRVEAAVVRAPGGARMRVEAKEFVVAAGTVETVRLLLASRSVMREGVGNAKGQVGLGFQDHLTLLVATFTEAARERVLREWRPWVVGGTVHSLKLDAGRELRERMGWNAVLAHVTVDEAEGSGVAVVREMLMGLQRGELRRVLGRDVGRLPGAVMEASRLAWEAKVQGRRFVSAGAVVRLQLNAAQDVGTASRVRLGEGRDALGMLEVVVDWRVSEAEVRTLRGFAEMLRERLEAVGMRGVAWVPEVFDERVALPGLEDARHAMGGARMGVDARSSVVDGELRVWGVGNLSVAGAAVFPDGAAQLPTLTMVALGLRLADRLARGLRGS